MVLDNENLSKSNLNGNLLRKLTVKIRLERIDTQKGVIVEVLLDSEAMRFRVCKKIRI